MMLIRVLLVVERKDRIGRDQRRKIQQLLALFPMATLMKMAVSIERPCGWKELSGRQCYCAAGDKWTFF
jgi:hypothetical protein